MDNPNVSIEEMIHLIPKNIDLELQRCMEELDDLRKEMVIKQRRLILLPLCTKRNAPSCIPSNTDAALSLITARPNETLDSVAPQHIQYISKIYEFFINNPGELAATTFYAYDNLSKNEFSFFAKSVIPSVYGFYSSADHAVSAYRYFCAVISKGNVPLIETVLKPFFCNGLTYRYIESVIALLETNICLDARVSPRNITERFINEKHSVLLKAVLDNLPVLPTVHFSILQYLKNVGFSSHEILHFLTKCFVYPEVINQLRASEFNHFIDFFIQLMKRPTPNIELDKYLNDKSYNELPSSYSDFNLHYMCYIVTPYDTAVLISLAKQAITIPRIIQMIEQPEFYATRSYEPLWILFYPRKTMLQIYGSLWKNVVFGSLIDCDINDSSLVETSFKLYKDLCDPVSFVINQAKLFETLLIYKMIKKAITSLRDDINFVFDTSMTAFFTQRIKTTFKELKFKELLKTEESKHFKRCMHSKLFTSSCLIVYHATRTIHLMRELGMNFDSLESKWNHLIQNNFADFNLTSIAPQVKSMKVLKVFLNVINRFNAIGSTTLEGMFFIITKSVKTTKVLRKSCKLPYIECAVKMCMEDRLITAVLLIGVFMQGIRENLPKDTIEAWDTFQGVVYDFLKKDESLMNMFSTIQCNILAKIS